MVGEKAQRFSSPVDEEVHISIPGILVRGVRGEGHPSTYSLHFTHYSLLTMILNSRQQGLMNECNDVEMKSSLPINPIMQYYPIRSVSADHTAETARISCGFFNDNHH